ncbi:MAG: hypothetical protein J0M02_00795 [Planctomycetes bacterium]|nr:hypothetical protein [Planctomycetota bacterium]
MVIRSALAPALLLLAAALSPAAEPAKPLLRDFMGINFHTFQVGDPTLYAQTCRLARDYHPFPWDVEADTAAAFPFPFSREKMIKGKPVDWTAVYGGWRAAGYTKIDACIMQTDYTRDKFTIKNHPGDLERYGREFAAFFGPSGSHPLVDSMEVENEPEKWTDDAYRELFVAMARGIRAGDPKMKITPCNMTVLKPDNRWEKPLQILAGQEALFDAISMHVYSLKAGWPSFERTYPEAPGIPYLTSVDAMIAYRAEHKELAGKELWITEFGYDAASPQALKSADPKWVSSTELQQAQWLVRSFLLFAARDVQRAYIYFFDDADGKSFHAASGITRKGTPKPAFFAVRHLFAALGDYRFKRVVVQDADAVYVYEFANDVGAVAWTVWSPTSGHPATERKIAGAPGQVLRAEHLATTDEKPAPVKCQVASGNLMLSVDESPTLVFFKPKH